ncbi:MAG: hypothetical protein M1296_05625 [Chloroflexi bacterium]|nr:hypothetical protein [Chloroflexota bacterium]
MPDKHDPLDERGLQSHGPAEPADPAEEHTDEQRADQPEDTIDIRPLADEEESELDAFYALHFTPLPMGWGAEIIGSGDSPMAALQEAYLSLDRSRPLRMLVLESMPALGAIASILGTDLHNLTSGGITIAPSAPEPFEIRQVAQYLNHLVSTLEDLKAAGRETTSGAELGSILGPVDLGLWLVIHIYLTDGDEEWDPNSLTIAEALTMARQAAIHAEMDTLPFSRTVH